MQVYSHKTRRTSKLALVFLILLSSSTTWFLFNEYYLSTSNSFFVQWQNMIYKKVAANLLNIMQNLYFVKNNIKKDIAQNAKYSPALIWCRPIAHKPEQDPEYKDCYLIDKQGIVFANYNADLSLDLIKVKEKIYAPLLIGEQFINPELIYFIINLQKLMPKKINIQPKEYLTPNIKTNRLEVLNFDKQKFIFNVQNNLKEQLIIISKVFKILTREQRKNLDYIGVDVKGQVYYK